MNKQQVKEFLDFLMLDDEKINPMVISFIRGQTNIPLEKEDMLAKKVKEQVIQEGLYDTLEKKLSEFLTPEEFEELFEIYQKPVLRKFFENYRGIGSCVYQTVMLKAMELISP